MTSATTILPFQLLTPKCISITTYGSTPYLPLPSKPINLTHFSSWAKKTKIPLTKPFVPKISDWSQQTTQESETGEEESYSEPPEDAKIFVGNLPYDVDSEKLAQMFTSAGVVEISEVIYNRDTEQSRGFGFVTMSTVEEADKAVEKFNGYDLGGRALTVNKAAPRGSQPERRIVGNSFKVYVGNLAWEVDSDRLEKAFSEHGKVVDARVIYDRESGRSRGFGFVTMASEAEMNDAVAALDGQNLDGRAIKVNVAEERPRRSFF